MRIDLPPALFHGVGILLIVFGTLRAYHLGWQRRLKEVPPDPEAEDAAAPDDGAPPPEPVLRPDPAARRHIMFGVLWVAMGIFLVVSTYINSRR
jgi:hypothetical protein